jgi:SagB-type dehydrogenase family enzyme
LPRGRSQQPRARNDDRAASTLEDAWRAVPRGALDAGWDPLSAAFHFGTKDIAWMTGADYEASEARDSRRALTDPPPSPFKKTRGRGTALPLSEYEGGFTDVLLARRTWRGFGRRAIRREDLGTLLDLSFGAQMAGRPQSGGEVLFKTSPSGGACHPIEAYVLALRVSGLTRGLYHFSPRSSRLYRIRKGSTARQAVGYLAGQKWFGGAAVVVFMTAVLPRFWRRYSYARSYRAVLLEAGHVCQTFCLVATWLGLAPFCTMALDDSRVERDLGIDGVGEVLLYAAGAGTRPADGRWVQWPGHRPVPRHPIPSARRASR